MEQLTNHVFPKLGKELYLYFEGHGAGLYDAVISHRNTLRPSSPPRPCTSTANFSSLGLRGYPVYCQASRRQDIRIRQGREIPHSHRPEENRAEQRLHVLRLGDRGGDIYPPSFLAFLRYTSLTYSAIAAGFLETSLLSILCTSYPRSSIFLSLWASFSGLR